MAVLSISEHPLTLLLSQDDIPAVPAEEATMQHKILQIRALELVLAALCSQLYIEFSECMSCDLHAYSLTFENEVWDAAPHYFTYKMAVATLVAMRTTQALYAATAAKFFKIRHQTWPCEKLATFKMEMDTKFPPANDWLLDPVEDTPVNTEHVHNHQPHRYTHQEVCHGTAELMGMPQAEPAEPGYNSAETGEPDGTKRNRPDTPCPGSHKRRQRVRITWGEDTIIDNSDNHNELDDMVYASQPQEECADTPPLTLTVDAEPESGATDNRTTEQQVEGHAEELAQELDNLKTTRPRGFDKHKKKHRSTRMGAAGSKAPPPTPLNKHWDRALRAQMRWLHKNALNIKALADNTPVPHDSLTRQPRR